jgi:hypothetical protein
VEELARLLGFEAEFSELPAPVFQPGGRDQIAAAGHRIVDQMRAGDQMEALPLRLKTQRREVVRRLAEMGQAGIAEHHHLAAMLRQRAPHIVPGERRSPAIGRKARHHDVGPAFRRDASADFLLEVVATQDAQACGHQAGGSSASRQASIQSSG